MQFGGDGVTGTQLKWRNKVELMASESFGGILYRVFKEEKN